MTEAPPSTREALLSAAEELFAAKGYAAVGTRELAARAGANLSAIKYHFGSKRELYLEVVTRAVERRETAASWDLLEESASTPVAAARSVVRFLRDFLEQILTRDDLGSATRILLQEAMHPSEAIEGVIEHFGDPRRDRLEALIAVIAPALAPAERGVYAGSIMSQFVQYAIFRPLMPYVGGPTFADPAHRRALADRIAAFSLRGLGCDAALVEQALDENGAS